YNNDIILQHSPSKKNKQLTNDENKIRIEKRSYQEHPPAKGIQKQSKPTKKTKVTKSHKAIR
ncbi:MAG: hypothetical protein HW420_1416, partial [Candidatus Nitrosotenuis sp.]|nr:hypothetical protein [Candidatus Nitrosotenuis sp.]